MAHHAPPVDATALRKFGLLVGGVFCAIGLWPLIFGRGLRAWAIVVGLALILPALVVPRALRPVHKIWMALGEALGYVNTRILLGLVFYGIVTPMGLAKRRFGEDPMRRGHDPAAPSYRVPKAPRPGEHMKRQF